MLIFRDFIGCSLNLVSEIDFDPKFRLYRFPLWAATCNRQASWQTSDRNPRTHLWMARLLQFQFIDSSLGGNKWIPTGLEPLCQLILLGKSRWRLIEVRAVGIGSLKVVIESLHRESAVRVNSSPGHPTYVCHILRQITFNLLRAILGHFWRVFEMRSVWLTVGPFLFDRWRTTGKKVII